MPQRLPLIRLTALSAVLGVAITVVVSWSCTLFLNPASGWLEGGHGPAVVENLPYRVDADGERPNLSWYATVAGTTGRVHTVVFYQWLPDDHEYLRAGQPRAESTGLTLGLSRVPRAIADGSTRELAKLVEAAGWPCLALSSELSVVWSTPSGPRPASSVGIPGIPVTYKCDWFAPLPLVGYPSAYGPIYPSARRQLPMHPLWGGFLANAVLYTLIIAASILTVAASRRQWRLRRMRCPVCGHPVSHTAVCAECGEPLPSIEAADDRRE